MTLYNQVYGKYSLGTGFWLEEPLFIKGKKHPYDDDIIESYIDQVSSDLKKINALSKINKNDVMDVGTGRQALAFYKLGAKSVDHYDISKTNITKFNQHLIKNKIPITSINVDICEENFNKNKLYDFIYLQGIIQHVKDPYTAILNLSKACKTSGKIWFYHYQSGSVVQLYAEAFRHILQNKVNLDLIQKHLKAIGISIKNIDVILDDCGCTYRHLLKSNFYKQAMESCGFINYFQKDVVDQSKGLDLRITRSACITAYVKKQTEIKKNSTFYDLKHVDHFDSNNYISEQMKFVNEIRVIKNNIENICSNTSMSKLDLISVCTPLFLGILNYKMNQPFKKITKDLKNNFLMCLQIAKNLS